MQWGTATPGGIGEPGGPVGWALIALLLLAVAAATSVRIARSDERLVVRRRGQVRAVRGPGLVVALPVVDRLVSVSLSPVRLDPLVVTATTRDGFEVTVWASASCRVVDPAPSVAASQDPLAGTADVLRLALGSEIGGTDLADLLSTPLGARAQHRTRRLSAASGIEVSAVETGQVELRLSTDLLSWAHRGPALLR